MIQSLVVPNFNLGTLIGNLVGLAILAAALMTIIYLVWGGVEWISSGGDKAGMEAAKQRITNAFIGLTIAVSSWAIMMIISTFLGFPFPCLPIPSLSGMTSTCATSGGENSVCYNDCLKKENNAVWCRAKCGEIPKGSTGNAGDTCTSDSTCSSKVCSFGKCAYDCSRDITHTFGDSECWTHNSCEWKNNACVYRKGFP